MVLLLEGSADLVGLDPMSQMTPMLRASLGGHVVAISALVGATGDANPSNCMVGPHFSAAGQAHDQVV